jgi:hypothetical protein
MIESIPIFFIVLLALILIWVGLKLLLKLTAKLFSCGCLIIFLLGLLWAAINFSDLLFN